MTKSAVIASKQALDSFASATIHEFIRTLQAVRLWLYKSHFIAFVCGLLQICVSANSCKANKCANQH